VHGWLKVQVVSQLENGKWQGSDKNRENTVIISSKYRELRGTEK